MTIDFDLENIDIPLICPTLEEDSEGVNSNEEDIADVVSTEQVWSDAESVIETTN